MSLETTMANARAFQASQFLSTGTVVRTTGTPTFDPITGAYASGSTTTIYTGACAVRPITRQDAGRETQAGEQEMTLLGYEGRLPVNTAVRKDDILTVTASTYDTGMVGKPLRITDVPWNNLQIARVVLLEEVVE